MNVKHKIIKSNQVRDGSYSDEGGNFLYKRARFANNKRKGNINKL